ncbi:hypothetical protein [Thiothrix winogradskyi]|uniref:Lipoprotein n=1 Tax=Thiothrix winogradskyi TaxID=96472 RepID=A0ABY3SWQ9_9GAMM|nr:hypothetical protein [Thiothrix winogradskyi]UJS22931.1 hypothetical protein L2Y54_13375 [Thiothrix winogradskyi]
MRKWMVVAITGILSACTGGHNLDSPLKTCKAVTVALAGDKGVVWHSEQQTEQKGVQLQITLEFALEGQGNEVSQAVCIYGLSSPDTDYRNAMGEYANTPTQMMINGMAIPAGDLVQAINRATADTAKDIGQKAVDKINEKSGY